MGKYTAIGGQALIEGILMKSPEKTAMAVRKPDGDIDISYFEGKSLREKYKILKLPIIRGIVGFAESMVQGYKAMMISAERSGFTDLEEENTKNKAEETAEEAEAAEETAEPATYYFLPIHMNKKCFGYSVLSYGNTNKVFDITYKNWTKHVCNALEYFRIQSKVSSFALIDVLTGSYTRAGVQQNINMLLNHIHDENYRFLVMMMDLDELKYINDTFGHQSGDQAIHEIAKALRSVSSEVEICARIGGDEFVLLGCDDYPDDKIETTIHRLFEILDNINRSGKYPFKLSASIGGAMGQISQAKDIESLYKTADSSMYAMKSIHHQK